MRTLLNSNDLIEIYASCFSAIAARTLANPDIGLCNNPRNCAMRTSFGGMVASFSIVALSANAPSTRPHLMLRHLISLALSAMTLAGVTQSS